MGWFVEEWRGWTVPIWQFASKISFPLLIVTLCFLMISVMPRPGHTETLKQALNLAYRHNPTILAERARQRATDEGVSQAISGWRPTVSVTGHVGRNKERVTPPTTHSDLDQTSVGISLSQPIFRGFRTINETRRAEAQVQAGQGQLRDTEQNTLLSAVKAYMDVLRDRQILRLRRSNINFLARELDISKSRFREGERTRTDVDQARTRLHQGRAELAEAKANLHASEATYASIIGHLPRKLSSPKSISALLPKHLQSAIVIATAENPLILAANHRKDAAMRDADVIRGELLPTVSLDASYQRDHHPNRFSDREDNGTISLRFSMPLYKSGETYSRIRQANATVEQRTQELANTRSQVKASVISAWQRRQAAKSRIRAAKRAVRSAKAAVKGIRIEANAGERSVSDILDAQGDVVNAEVELTNARRDFVVTGFSLLATLGQLTVDHLKLDVEAHEPNRNLRAVRYQPIGETPGGFITTVTRAKGN